MLVRAIGSSNLAELSNKEYGRPSTSNDVDLVDIGCAVWGICSRATFQHSSYRTATVFQCVVRSIMGTVLDLRKVSSYRLLVSFNGN